MSTSRPQGARNILVAIASAAAPFALLVAVGCPGPGASNTQPTSPPASTVPDNGITKVPASHKYYVNAYDNCLSCHTTKDPSTGNKIRFMPFPDNHADRTQASCITCHFKAADTEPPVLDLNVPRVTSVPDNDPATDDSVWASATGVDIPVKGGVNKSETTVKLKAVHDGTTVYFRAVYDDLTESLERVPFVKQADGTWKKAKAWPDKYEDKVSFIWNNPAKPMANFNTQGCAVTCHGTTKDWASNRPLKYTNSDDEFGDMWHAKTARHAATGIKLIDDQYVWRPPGIENGATPTDTTDRWGKPFKGSDLIKDGGRRGDPKNETWSGDYISTPTESDGTPKWMPASEPFKVTDGRSFWMTATQSFDTSKFVAGDKLASHVVLPMTGSRADIPGSARWANGKWTYEFKRAMTPTHADDRDTKFEAGKTYYMGAAVFDNNQIGHAVQFGVTKVTFGN